jgi:hypothetical protein
MVLLEKLGGFRCGFCSLGLKADDAGILDGKVNFAWGSHVAVAHDCSSSPLLEKMLLWRENGAEVLCGNPISWLMKFEHCVRKTSDVYIDERKVQA